MNTGKGTQVTVVIPMYKARNLILKVINGIRPEVTRITKINKQS